MKKPLLITIGVVLILLVLGVWVYLMLFGTPRTTGEIFSDFGLVTSGQPINPVEPLIEESPATQVDTTGEVLRQLTTRPVAGYVFSTTASSSVITYAEVGTGHIYSLDLTTGDEVRISGTTIPRVTEAVFSEDATKVALTSETSGVRDVFAGSIVSTDAEVGTIEGSNLPPNARDLDWQDNEVRYTLVTTDGTAGYSFDPTTSEQTQSFVSPFRAITTIWRDNETFIFNQPTSQLEGALYQIVETQMTPVVQASYTFTGLVTDNFYITTNAEEQTLQSKALDRGTTTEQPISVIMIPEKCADVATNPAELWCAAPIETVTPDYLENWYKGTIIASDVLWNINLFTGAATLAIDPSAVSGRTIDLHTLQYQSEQITFINKLDNTLWLYDSTVN